MARLCQVDQRADGKLTYNINLTPQDDWFFNYEFSVDKFQNDVRPVTFANVSQWAGPALTFVAGRGSPDPAGFCAGLDPIQQWLARDQEFW